MRVGSPTSKAGSPRMKLGDFKHGNKYSGKTQMGRMALFAIFFAVVIFRDSTLDLLEAKIEGVDKSVAVLGTDRPFDIGMKMLCETKTEKENELLKKEIRDYEMSPKFKRKIMECKGEEDFPPRQKVILLYLKEKVLQKGWSILDLGAAAGGMLRMVIEAYNMEGNLMGQRGKFQGVELVQGWVDFASQYFSDHTRWGDVEFVQGDITDFELPEKGRTFDFVMLNDVMEHLQKNRYGCFFEKLKSVTHSGSVVYMHTPTPATQVHDSDQYFENVLPHHVLLLGMAQAGFELLNFELDSSTSCRKVKLHKAKNLPRQADNANCYFEGFVKYYHATFYRVHDERVFRLN